jgi:hypothetical protein
MAKYALNEAAVRNCRRLIDARQYVLNSDWGEVQPRADDQNTFLERHSWRNTQLGISASPMASLTRRRPVTHLCTATSGACTVRP